jgi:N-methylhydantoinase B
LRIPTLLAYRNYQPVEEVWELIFANVRGRTEREWDLRAGYAGCATAERGLRRIAKRYGVETVREVMSRAIQDTQARIEARIEAAPDGRYTAYDWFEGDGWSDRPIRLEVAVEINGSGVHMDWTGTERQVKGGVNLPFSSTFGVGIYALKSVFGADLIPNAGLWRPLTVSAPLGTLVNPLPPAPTQASAAETIQRCADLLMMALASAVPEDVMAGTFASASVLMLEARDALDWRRDILGRERTVFMDNSPGGMGARRAGDGVSGIKVHTGNARVASVEIAEFSVPIRGIRWQRVPDTGGAGRERGGCAVAREWEMLDDDVQATLMTERGKVPPFGLFGGRAGATGSYRINPGERDEKVLPSKTPPVQLRKGDRYLMQCAGGGGRGPAWERPVAAVIDDVLDGYVTIEGAARDYGVVLAADGTIDEVATQSRRADLAAAAPVPSPDRGEISYRDLPRPE